jgi:hypothetical protein
VLLQPSLSASGKNGNVAVKRLRKRSELIQVQANHQCSQSDEQRECSQRAFQGDTSRTFVGIFGSVEPSP